jgi:hypothetical protein
MRLSANGREVVGWASDLPGKHLVEFEAVDDMEFDVAKGAWERGLAAHGRLAEKKGLKQVPQPEVLPRAPCLARQAANSYHALAFPMSLKAPRVQVGGRWRPLVAVHSPTAVSAVFEPSLGLCGSCVMA